MARKVTTQRKLIVTAIAWTLGILIFFPILWTFLTSFKSEADAIASPPQFLFFHWTTENYAEVQSRSNYLSHFMDSTTLAVLRPTPGNLTSSSRVSGTLPPNWSTSICESAITFFALLR